MFTLTVPLSFYTAWSKNLSIFLSAKSKPYSKMLSQGPRENTSIQFSSGGLKSRVTVPVSWAKLASRTVTVVMSYELCYELDRAAYEVLFTATLPLSLKIAPIKMLLLVFYLGSGILFITLFFIILFLLRIFLNLFYTDLFYIGLFL